MSFKKIFFPFLLALSPLIFINVKAFASFDVPIENEREEKRESFEHVDLTEPEIELPESVKSAHQAIWNVNLRTGNGTGFFVGPNHFVTNFHVVASAIKESDTNKYLKNYSIDDIYLSQENTDQEIEIKRVLAVSFYPDLALLETESSSPHWLDLRESALFSEEELSSEEDWKNPPKELFISGYPHGRLHTVKSKGPIKINEWGDLLFNYSRLTTDLRGASGSPVLDSSAHVAGILYSSYRGGSLPVSISIEDLRSFIEKSNCEEQGSEQLFKNICGLSLKQRLQMALAELQDKAENNPKAQFELARIHLNGLGVERNSGEAFCLMKESAEEKFPEAQYEMFLIYRDREEEVLQCENNFFDLDWFLTFFSNQDHASNQDEHKQQALSWLKKAAEQGYAPAQYKLFYIYKAGEIVEQNEEQALYWLKKAAEQGYAPAKYDLAIYYAYGIEVEKDLKMSFHLMTQLADQNYAPAQNEIQRINFNLRLEVADQGDALAQYELFSIYRAGEIVPQDKEQALHWLIQSAEQGYAPAQYELFYIFKAGEIVLPDEGQVFYLLMQASDQGYAPAQHDLAIYYAYGMVVEKDLEISFELMKKAAEQGYAPAQNEIQRMKEEYSTSVLLSLELSFEEGRLKL